jgi:predicted nucleotidyltransferase component of viral defense system
MAKPIKNIAASIREKLLQLAKQSGRSFDAILRLYCQERFLYRLSVSSYRKNFVLKGGLLFLSLPCPIRRPTVDIDFAGRAIADDHETLKEVFTKITRIVYSDGIEYHPERLIIRNIKEGTDFSGSRILIPAELSKAKISLQIDVAFGDAIAKGPRTIDFPTLLDLPKPSIFAYSIVSMIAEKFEAIISRQTATSRMKDFFDIAYLAESMPFNGKELQEAFERTFGRRSADLHDCESVFGQEFAQNPGLAMLWKGFLARNDLESTGDFPAVMVKIKRFLEPVIARTCEDKTWDSKECAWVKMF